VFTIEISYDAEFTSLIKKLKKKYGEKLFEIEGIGKKQLDFNSNAKNFLTNDTTTADVSVDANANVDTRDVVGYQFEMPKPIFRLNSLYLLWEQIKKTDGVIMADGIIEAQITGVIYINDFSDIGRPYCFNFSTYDIVCEGLPMIKKITSVAPKYLYSFKSQVEQFVVVASNSTLGATGLADLLICMSLYVQNIIASERLAKDEDGDDHTAFYDGKILVGSTHDDIWAYVKENIVSLIYTLNQPMRGNQSPFTNVSLYDREFLKSLCPGYMLNGVQADPDIVWIIQKVYMQVMNEEMRRTPITFPVTTACFATHEGKVLDSVFKRLIAEQNVEWGFMNIYHGETSTLSSCCRLRSNTENEYFNSFGAGSTKIGSLGVVTLNLPRLAFEACSGIEMSEDVLPAFFDSLFEAGEMANIINDCKRQILKKRVDRGNMPLYTYGHMNLKKQYSPIGVTGLYECLEILGYDIMKDDGLEIAKNIIAELNKVCAAGQEEYEAPHNLEQVPAESSAVKLADKDYFFEFNCALSLGISDRGIKTVKKYPYYSNQFFPLTAKADMLDRIRLQGELDKHFSGGAIQHINVEEKIDNPDRIEELIDYCAMCGVVYWAINYAIRRCSSGHMSIGRDQSCDCGAQITDNFTRVVGFLTNVANWNEVRREYDHPNRQFYK